MTSRFSVLVMAIMMLLAVACGREDLAECGSHFDCGPGQSCIDDQCVASNGGWEDPYTPRTPEDNGNYWDMKRNLDGEIQDCNDDNPCTKDYFDGNACVNDPIDGVACDDGNPGTMSDTCYDGQCVGVAFSCDDGLDCTTDVSSGNGMCSNTLQPGFCVINRTCIAAGTLHPDTPCKSCNPDASVVDWTTAAAGSACDDGERLTIDDQCSAEAVCAGTPVECTLATDCDDGLVCNGEEACTDNACAPGEAVTCNGNLACTEPEGECACLPPFYLVGDVCTAPDTFGTMEYADLEANSYDDGANLEGGFTDGPARLVNNYDTEYGSWDGFALSSITDNTTPGWGNQYSAIPGGGALGSSSYAMAYINDWAVNPAAVTLTDAGENGYSLAGMYITNSTYAYLSMLNGDDYAKKFGGEDGTEADWLLLEIIGMDAEGNETGRVPFYLADFRFENSADDYIVDEWTFVPLESLGNVAELRFALSSTDNGDWGMNTPAYFAMDTIVRQPAVATMNDSHLLADAEYFNGADNSGGFFSGSIHFNNNYDDEYGSWDGFALSRMTDTTTAGPGNQYSAITGAGLDDNSYAVSYISSWAATPATVTLTDAPMGRTLGGMYITNCTYAYLSMLNGDDYAKKFGGADGTEEDWFLLEIIGIDAEGNETGRVPFYLADFRFADDAEDYIVDQWTWVALDSLGDVTSLRFALSSSDNGDWGMNTPSYFALDTIAPPVAPATMDDSDLLTEAEFYNGADSNGGFTSGSMHFNNAYNDEYASWDGFALSRVTDTTTAGPDNQYSAITGAGVDGDNYAVSYVSSWAATPATITLQGAPYSRSVSGMYITNTTYAYLSMLNGDDYAKKFGGADGTEPDWFLLEIIGMDAEGNETSRVGFYLADFRFADDSKDYIINDWNWVPLETLGDIAELRFALSSSDNGDWGMNTPSYFALDNVDAAIVR